MPRKSSIYLLFLFLFAVLFCGCGRHQGEKKPASEQDSTFLRDLKEIIDSDTLRIATMRGATSCFLFQKTLMGYDYELITNFAKHLNVYPAIRIAHTEQELTQLLASGAVDIIACNVYETKELKAGFRFVFPRSESHQVLVQRLGRNSLTTAADLTGKDIYVKKNSIFHRRLDNLNDETGGEINIRFAPDSLTTDDLIEMVLNGEIEYTAAFHDQIAIYLNYSRKLANQVPIGFTQRGGWLMRKDAPELHAALNEWKELAATVRLQERLESKYKLQNPYLAGRKVKIPEGAISPYDELFKKYAPQLGWDWRVLAAIAFHESTFDSATVSPAGAAGLMQLMPATAENYGVDSISIFNPEENIKASVEYLKEMSKLFRQVTNSNERTKFILAGYNGGPYHVIDAMALAERYGKNPQLWNNNVEYFLDQKSEPDFYHDSVVKYGSFNARETVRYVDNILSTYESFLK